MPAKDNENTEKQTEVDAADAPQKAEASEALDFANMDLSVESVEERISPSETNVFDK